MSWKAALETVLPELGEPRVAGVGAEPELQEVVVKGGDLFRLQLHSDAAHRLLLISLHHLIAVCPTVTAEKSMLQLPFTRTRSSLCLYCINITFES